MSIVEPTSSQGREPDSDVLTALDADLKELEHALAHWDLAAIAGRSAAVRTTLARAQLTPAVGRQRVEYLRAIMTRVRRCAALAEQGAALSQSLNRVSALTYSPSSTDKRR